MNMLSLQKQSRYIKRQVKLLDGSLALVVFELVEKNGKIIAKPICGKVIKECVPVQEEILSLPVYFEKETFKPIVSPFYSKLFEVLKDLSFVTSQPARAPNFI